MKKTFGFVAALVIGLAITSCRKEHTSTTIEPTVERKIRFQLYTNQDFSGDGAVIKFSVFIRNANKTLFDSSLASMQIKDIPDAAHKLTIEKTVPGNDNTNLAAGFIYEIENVGISWHIDTIKAGSTFKVIDYAFQ